MTLKAPRGPMSTSLLRAPFPYFGAKSRIASVIWDELGILTTYIEPFAGSLAVLLARPNPQGVEIVNDADPLLVNFWRSVRDNPVDTADWASYPPNEADLHARHLWLIRRKDFVREKLAEPDYSDAKIAGWWVWGLCCYTRGVWCCGDGRWVEEDGLFVPRSGTGSGERRSHPNISLAGMGVCRGVMQQCPPRGVLAQTPLQEWFVALSSRLKGVEIRCGDWKDAIPESFESGTGMVLDPPYEGFGNVYGCKCSSNEVRDFAIRLGDEVRIALCGYFQEHEMPGWSLHVWSATGGMSRTTNAKFYEQRHKERIWFSPACRTADRSAVEAER